MMLITLIFNHLVTFKTTDAEMRKLGIQVPQGKLAVEDDAAAASRRGLRDKLLRGENVQVTQTGELRSAEDVEPSDGPAIQVPQGKFASLFIPGGVLGGSFYWYENRSELYQSEVAAMQKYFPSFKLQKLSDGRLSWVGTVRPKNVRKNAAWLLQAVYDHNHPSNSNWGGSVRIYSVDPDLTELQSKIQEPIPHLLRDPNGNVYMCTARREDVKTGYVTTSAASSLAWAVKWITVFELWIAGDVSTAQFRDHTF